MRDECSRLKEENEKMLSNDQIQDILENNSRLEDQITRLIE